MLKLFASATVVYHPSTNPGTNANSHNTTLSNAIMRPMRPTGVPMARMVASSRWRSNTLTVMVLNKTAKAMPTAKAMMNPMKR